MAAQQISIIIPTYKRVEQTIKTLRLLLESKGIGEKFTLEIIVSDSSPDELLKEELPKTFNNQITYIRPDPPGISAAKNAGAQKATGEIIIFCDSDIEVEEDTLLKTLAALEDPTVAAITGNVTWRGGAKDGKTDIPHAIDRIKKINNTDYIECIYSRYMATYKKVFEAVGGYDQEVFNMRGEGSDLSIRYWRKGFPLAFSEEITVHHVFDAPDSAALRVKDPFVGVAKDLFLLAYKYDLLDGEYKNFAATLRADFDTYNENSYLFLVQGIGRNLDLIVSVKEIIDQEKKKMESDPYNFKFLEVFSDSSLLNQCINASTSRLAELEVK